MSLTLLIICLVILLGFFSVFGPRMLAGGTLLREVQEQE